MKAWTSEDPAGSQVLGLEQERFLVRRGVAASDVQAIAMFDGVAALANAGYAPGLGEARRKDEAWIVNSRHGPVKLSFEGYPHQIEAALPPVVGLSEMIGLHESVWSVIEASAAGLGLELGEGAHFSAPSHVRLSSTTPPAKRRRFVTFEDASFRAGRFSSATYLASVCATQLHLNSDPDVVFGLLPALYAYMYIVPALFSESRGPVHNMRMLVLRDSYPQGYPLALFPSQIPGSALDHARLVGACDGGRDYSLIAPRSFGTLEFRAADAQTDPDRLAELCAFYVLLVRSASAGLIGPREGADELFWTACESGLPDASLLLSDLAAIAATCCRLPDPVTVAFSRLVERASRLASLADSGLNGASLPQTPSGAGWGGDLEGGGFLPG
jgi:hypothetical protein